MTTNSQYSIQTHLLAVILRNQMMMMSTLAILAPEARDALLEGVKACQPLTDAIASQSE